MAVRHFTPQTHTAHTAPGSVPASGLYLGAYFLGGLAGSALLGWAFDSLGWNACVLCLGAALIAAAALSYRFVIDD
jgi:hypothetical protein